MSQHIVYLNEENYENEVLKSTTPVLIDFYADWCGPCQALAPTMDVLAEQFTGKAKICKLNIDENRKLALSNKVMSIPTLFFVKDGEIVERITGGLPQAALEEKLNELI